MSVCYQPGHQTCGTVFGDQLQQHDASSVCDLAQATVNLYTWHVLCFLFLIYTLVEHMMSLSCVGSHEWRFLESASECICLTELHVSILRKNIPAMVKHPDIRPKQPQRGAGMHGPVHTTLQRRLVVANTRPSKDTEPQHYQGCGQPRREQQSWHQVTETTPHHPFIKSTAPYYDSSRRVAVFSPCPTIFKSGVLRQPLPLCISIPPVE